MHQSIEQFGDLIDQFEAHHLQYRIVGGIARDSYLKIDSPPINDIDIIFGERSHDHTDHIPQPQKLYLDTHLRESTTFSQDHAQIRILGETFSVQPELFEERSLYLNGIKFPSVDPRTLLHLYLIQGPLRPKDWTNAIALSEKISKDNIKCFPETYFNQWHRLAKETYRKKQPTLFYKWLVRRIRKMTPEKLAAITRPISVPILVYFENLVARFDCMPN